MIIKTDYREFEKFHRLLMSNAPKSYTKAWVFPVEENGKNPDGLAIYKRADKTSSCCNAEWVKVKRGKTTRTVCEKCGIGWGSWKAPHARLTKEEAVERLKIGGNIGISSREWDLLVIYDRDDASVKDKVTTLTTLSRKRIAGHSFCWRKEEDKSLNVNIPTDQMGEVRSIDQYVVCAGSFVPTEKKDKDAKDDKLGLYSVENELPPASITLKDLPDIFLEQLKKNEENIKRINELPKRDFKTIAGDGKKSALFNLTIEDIIGTYCSSERFAHPIHGSKETNANFSVGDGVAHCWRCLVSLNALQFLTVKSGYMTCDQAGTGHKKGSPSAIIGDDGAIYHAWKQAQKDGLIPLTDKMPYRAMLYKSDDIKLIRKARFS